MTTLAELAIASNYTFTTFVDEMFPAGHFGATAFVDGDLRGYLLEGAQDDPQAVVKGRIEYNPEAGKLVRYAFAQGGVTGGIPLGEVTDFSDIFAKMV